VAEGLGVSPMPAAMPNALAKRARDVGELVADASPKNEQILKEHGDESLDIFASCSTDVAGKLKISRLYL
jgi:hypothetical protein